MGFEDYSALPNTDTNFFQYQTSAYDNHSDLYDLLITESYNHNGVPLTYYITTYNTSADDYPDNKELFGEDNNREFVRKFPVMVYIPDLPKEMQMISIFGIEGLDNFKMWASKRHFTSASQDGGYDEYIPKEGDILYSAYNNMFYSIVDVGQEEEIFFQRQHSWEFTVEKFKDTNISLTPSISANMQELVGVTDRDDDIFDITDYISSASDDVLYNTSADLEDPNSIWGEWQ